MINRDHLAGSYTSPDVNVGGDRGTPLAREAEQHIEMLRRTQGTARFRRPHTTRTFVVANQKGGVGKTTTAVNIAAAMALRDLHVLVVDLDPQGNASTALRVPHSQGNPGVYEALVDEQPMQGVVVSSPDLPNISVLPASIDLAGAEIELVSLVARESRLERSLAAYMEHRDSVGDRVDYVLIDCPPSLGLLTVNAFVAAQEVLIPIQCEYYALEGLGQLVRNIELVRSHLNRSLEISTILLTMHDSRTNLSASVTREVREYFGAKVLHTAIPRSVRISEAPSYEQSVLTYDKSSPGALSYLEAAREISEQPRAHHGHAEQLPDGQPWGDQS